MIVVYTVLVFTLLAIVAGLLMWSPEGYEDDAGFHLRNEVRVAGFRTHGCATFWYDHGCPNRLGQEINVFMQSGRVAVFKLIKIERATDVDWNWYDFEFVRYREAGCTNLTNTLENQKL